MVAAVAGSLRFDSAWAVSSSQLKKMFEALYNRGINIHLIYTSEIKITVLIKESRVERAVEALKEQFQE